MFDKINNVRNWQLLHCVVSSEWKFTEDFLKKEVKKNFFKVHITHSSVTIQKVSFFSKASYSWRRRGCCSVFMISTSLMTSSLSCSPFTAINFAARNLPVFFSLHFFTSPNFPLQNQNLSKKLIWSTDLIWIVIFKFLIQLLKIKVHWTSVTKGNALD